MPFSRRSFFARFLPAVMGGTVGASLEPAVARATETVQKVVYHLSEPGRVNFVLGNIRNHIEGKGGPAKVRIVLVVHGPALKAFEEAKASPDMKRQVADRVADGVVLVACGNTLHGLSLEESQLMAGFSVASEGGVVRIADLQAEGYLYLRP